MKTLSLHIRAIRAIRGWSSFGWGFAALRSFAANSFSVAALPPCTTVRKITHIRQDFPNRLPE
jgi:hypothetical protein